MELKSKLNSMRGRFYEAYQDFERKRNEHNADYVERFSKIAANIELPKADYQPRRKFPILVVRGTKVSFLPDLLVTRVNRANKTKVGALMFRYAKGEPLSEDVAGYQSAFMFGYLQDRPFAEAAEAEAGTLPSPSMLTRGTLMPRPVEPRTCSKRCRLPARAPQSAGLRSNRRPRLCYDAPTPSHKCRKCPVSW